MQRTVRNIAPTEILLGREDSGAEHILHYVSLKETMEVLLQDKSIVSNMAEFKNKKSRLGSNVLSDYKDGSIYRKLYETHESEDTVFVDITCCQDEFEPWNVLGSSKTLHKTLALYFSLSNIDADHWLSEKARKYSLGYAVRVKIS